MTIQTFYSPNKVSLHVSISVICVLELMPKRPFSLFKIEGIINMCKHMYNVCLQSSGLAYCIHIDVV